MTALPKHGYDGNAPEFRETRDLDGKGKRETTFGPTNIRVDRLEWLLAHKRIELHQHQAGRRLQRDSETAQIGAYASLEGGRGGSGTDRLPDVKCDAIGRVNAVRMLLGGTGWRILELVVLDGISLGKAEGRLRMSTGAGIGALVSALDTLAAHYGLA